MLRTVSLLGLLVLFPGCAGAKGRQRADGTYLLDCSDKKVCLERANRTCGEEGYTVVGGRSNKKKYGSPGNEVYIGKDEMYIRCNRDRPADAPDPETGEWSLRRNDAAPSRTPGSATPSPNAGIPKSETRTSLSPDVRVCRPGETQHCVGAGACEGGQACLADGSGFGACDCGKSTPGGAANAVPVPSAAPNTAPGPRQ